MNRLSFLKAKRNKWYSGIFMIAFFFILLCFPVAIHSVFNLQQDVESNISHYARGSYDLLVRAEGNQHPLEEELGIVPENYIGFGQGGISIEQWEQIRDREDIEIARTCRISRLFYRGDFEFWCYVSGYKQLL